MFLNVGHFSASCSNKIKKVFYKRENSVWKKYTWKEGLNYQRIANDTATVVMIKHSCFGKGFASLCIIFSVLALDLNKPINGSQSALEKILRNFQLYFYCCWTWTQNRSLWKGASQYNSFYKVKISARPFSFGGVRSDSLLTAKQRKGLEFRIPTHGILQFKSLVHARSKWFVNFRLKLTTLFLTRTFLKLCSQYFRTC